MIQVGVVGLRFGAQVHVPAFRRDPRCTVVALAGRDAAATRAEADALAIPVAHAGWRAMVDDPRIEAISVAVPPALQPEIVAAAAARGKHVFCEKPLAASAAAAAAAAECVRRAGVVHAIDFIFPELDAWQRARMLLRDGAIGTPRHFAYAWRVETFAARTRSGSWKVRHEDGGGAIGNFLPHVIFNLEWLLAPVTGIQPCPSGEARRSTLFFDGVATLEGGIHGSVSLSADAFLGDGHKVTVFGESGTLVLSNATSDYATGFELHMGTRDGGRLEVIMTETGTAGVDGRIRPVSRIVRRFAEAIAADGPVAPNLDDGLRVQRWLQHLSDAQLS